MVNFKKGQGSKLSQLAQECHQDTKETLLVQIQKMDDLHLKNRNSKTWANIGFRKKKVFVPGIGLIDYKRRLYRNTKTKEYRFWLDKKLGIDKKFFVSKEDQKIVLDLYPKLRSYQNVADIGFGGLIHKNTVGRYIKNSGVKLELNQSFNVEKGVLWINADGLHVKENKSKKGIETKNFCFYTERILERKNRFRLKNRTLISLAKESEEKIRETVFKGVKQYKNVEKTNIIGDGALWIKNLAEKMGATFYIDKFHFHQAIKKNFKSEDKEEVFNLVKDKKLKTFELKQKLLKLVADPLTGEVQELKRQKINYLVQNRLAYLRSCEDKAYGTIEAMQSHYVAKFLKRQRKGFCVENLRKILTSFANTFNKQENYCFDDLVSCYIRL